MTKLIAIFFIILFLFSCSTADERLEVGVEKNEVLLLRSHKGKAAYAESFITIDTTDLILYYRRVTADGSLLQEKISIIKPYLTK
jgi:hypothetical protein